MFKILYCGLPAEQYVNELTYVFKFILDSYKLLKILHLQNVLHLTFQLVTVLCLRNLSQIIEQKGKFNPILFLTYSMYFNVAH